MKRILSVLICIFILLSTVACSTPPKVSPQKSYEEQKILYNDIIAQYTSLLTAKQNGEDIPVPDTTGMSQREIAISETLYGIINTCKDAQEAENLGYGYKDFDVFMLAKGGEILGDNANHTLKFLPEDEYIDSHTGKPVYNKVIYEYETPAGEFYRIINERRGDISARTLPTFSPLPFVLEQSLWDLKAPISVLKEAPPSKSWKTAQ